MTIEELREEDIADDESHSKWLGRMYEIAGEILIMMAKATSERFNNQSVELLDMRVRAGCFD